jgi:hypothetical protein
MNVALKDLTPPQTPDERLDVEQAEAALVEHYPRLVRLGYLVLPPSLSRHRRVLAAHALAQRALPRSRPAADEVPVPAPRDGAAETDGVLGAPSADRGYACVRLRVLRRALRGERPGLSGRLHRRLAPLPPALPQVWGLRLFPRSGGADELALDQALSGVSAAARAAYALRGLEGLSDTEVCATLEAAGVDEPQAALEEAESVVGPSGSLDGTLLQSAEFDPCALQARPTDLMRRRQHTRAVLAALAAAVVCGALLGLPGDSWGPDGAAAPVYAQNPAAQAALDPGQLTHAPTGAWKQASRVDFSVWPARGDLLHDKELLRRALAVWARPGSQVTVSATVGTQTGPPAGPPQLLFAGTVDGKSVVLLHDGQRLVRYAEPAGADGGGVVLDFARTDGGDGASASAVVLARSDTNVRYLTAPWVTGASVTDLLEPQDDGRALQVDERGVTDPVTGVRPKDDSCSRWPALELDVHGRRSPYVYTDLGELTPARLTDGPPTAAPRSPVNAASRASLARTACMLAGMRGAGVKTVNSWTFATQQLPEGDGTARWVCTRGETWRGAGSRVLAQFQKPGTKPAEPGAVAAQAEDSPACGARSPRALSGVLWKSRAGNWYLLAAGSEDVTSITASGGVSGTAQGRTLALPTKQGTRVDLTARLSDGHTLQALGSDAGDR